MSQTKVQLVDLNGLEAILDADADTSITADTDDQIDIKIGGADDFAFKANNFEVQSGSTIDMNGQELILDADADTSITADTDDKIEFKCGGLDTVNINKFGQVVHTRDSATTFGGSTSFIHQRGTIASPSIVNDGDTIGMIQTSAYDGTAYLDGPRILFQVDGTPGDDDMPTRIVFQTTRDGTAGTLDERMRLDDNQMKVTSATTAGTDPLIAFEDATGTDCGSIDINASANTVAYTTSSDYRLKENVNYNFDATSRLKQLKPSTFNFISEPDKTVDGFLAHEVSSIVPEAVTGTKDQTKTKTKVVLNSSGNVIAENIEESDWVAGKAADEDGNVKYPSDSTWEASKAIPVYQGIDQSKLVPLMVKTIQELEARIKTLEDA